MASAGQRRDAWAFLLGIAGISLALFLGNPGEYDMGTRWLALLVVAIGSAPMSKWLLSRTRTGLPIFEMYMLFHAVCFGLAGFMPGESTLTRRAPVTPAEWETALLASAASMSATVMGYYYWLSRAEGTPPRVAWPFRFDALTLGPAWPAMLATFILLKFAERWMPSETAQFSRGAGVVLLSVLVVISVRRQVPTLVRSLILFVIVPIDAFVLSSLMRAALVGIFLVLVPVGLAYIACTKRVPVMLGALVVSTFLAIQPLKGEYRSLAYVQDDIGVAGALGVASQVLDSGQTGIDVGHGLLPWLAYSFRRLNHLHVTAAVIADTPDPVPFLNGESYAPLLTKIVPRALWPEKPRETTGNAWAHRYGYLNVNDYGTSFNLPVLTEMFVNFGYAGLIGIGLAVGVLLGFVASRLWSRDGDSSLIAFGIAVALPVLSPESNLSMLLGSMAINAAVAYFVLVCFAYFFPTLRARGEASNPQVVRAAGQR